MCVCVCVHFYPAPILQGVSDKVQCRNNQHTEWSEHGERSEISMETKMAKKEEKVNRIESKNKRIKGIEKHQFRQEANNGSVSNWHKKGVFET